MYNKIHNKIDNKIQKIIKMYYLNHQLIVIIEIIHTLVAGAYDNNY